MIKSMLQTVATIVVVLVVLKIVKQYLPASLASWLP